MNYRFAYAVGFHPWEGLVEHPPFSRRKYKSARHVAAARAWPLCTIYEASLSLSLSLSACGKMSRPLLPLLIKWMSFVWATATKAFGEIHRPS